MRTLIHLTVGAAAAVALVTGSTVASSAQSQTLKDKRADVVQYEGYEDDDGVVLDRTASVRSGFDATRATIKHGKKSLRVTMRFAELGTGPVQVYGSIRIKGKKSWPSYQIISGSSTRVDVYNRSYSRYLCSGKITRKNGKNGTISYTIDRSCLKKPKALKVQTGVYGFDGDPTQEDVTIFDESISPSKVRSTSNTTWLRPS